MVISFTEKFKLPNVSSYDSNKDPIDHLENFKDWMDFYAYGDKIWY